VRVAKQFSEDTLVSGKLPSPTKEREPGMLDYSDVRPELSGVNRYRTIK
jgi:hypothetical protein